MSVRKDSQGMGFEIQQNTMKINLKLIECKIFAASSLLPSPFSKRGLIVDNIFWLLKMRSCFFFHIEVEKSSFSSSVYKASILLAMQLKTMDLDSISAVEWLSTNDAQKSAVNLKREGNPRRSRVCHVQRTRSGRS